MLSRGEERPGVLYRRIGNETLFRQKFGAIRESAALPEILRSGRNGQNGRNGRNRSKRSIRTDMAKLLRYGSDGRKSEQKIKVPKMDLGK